MQLSAGSEYYSNKTILVTGATGFVGKVLIATLLRTLPNLRRVYILIRPRLNSNGDRESPEETLRKVIFSSSAFETLRARHAEDFSAFAEQRVKAVAGDLGREGLGMEPRVYAGLQKEVDVVINSGALAVFDAPLDQAIQINTLGPQRVLEFVRGSARRPFVAHISTCYVSNVAGPVFEKPLDPGWTPAPEGTGDDFNVRREVGEIMSRVEEIRRKGPDGWALALRRRMKPANARRGKGGRNGSSASPARLREEWIEKELVEEGLRRARRRGWKDTYTYTKAMGEQLFAEHLGDVPALILRPSIIESALRTPAVGWIDGFRMMDPLIVGFARNQLFEFPGNPEAVVDLVPVDTVVNTLLMAIPWRHSGRGDFVYQVASGMDKPLTIKKFRDHMVEYFEQNPLRRGESNGSGNTKSLPELTFPEVDCFLRHLNFRYLMPLRALEAVYFPFKSTGWGKRRYSTLSSRRARLEWLRNTAAIYGPYGECQARFMTYNVRRMWEALSEKERRMFPFDLQHLDWKRYVQEVHLPGIERFLLRLPRRLNGKTPTFETIFDDETIHAGNESAGNGSSIESAASPEKGNGDADFLRWRKAEKLLSLTRELNPQEEAAWVTPLYKKAIQRLSFQVIRLICRKRLALECLGKDNIPERGPFIVVANHTSHLDTGVLLSALGPMASKAHPTAAADYWFRSKTIAWLLHSTLGGIPFDRHCPNVPRALALPAEVLRNGHMLIFYPEGTRSTNGKMHPFRSTVGLLALASGAPILPAHISGAAEALPKGESMIKRHPVRVRFGEPIMVEPYLASLDTETVSKISKQLAADAQAAVETLQETASAVDAPAGVSVVQQDSQ